MIRNFFNRFAKKQDDAERFDNSKDRYYCGTLLSSSKPLRKCCFASSHFNNRGLRLTINTLDIPTKKPENDEESEAVTIPSPYIYLQITGMSRFIKTNLNIRVQVPESSRIPKSQCLLAVSSFLGLMMAEASRYVTVQIPEDKLMFKDNHHVKWDDNWIRSLDDDDSHECFPPIHFDFEIVGIPKNENSLYNSLIYGLKYKNEETIPSGEELLSESDKLRAMVAYHVKKKKETLKEIIKDLDKYIPRITAEGTFGGEIEIAMASIALQCPIRVFWHDVKFGSVILLVEYGTESYPSKAINLLFYGDGTTPTTPAAPAAPAAPIALAATEGSGYISFSQSNI